MFVFGKNQKTGPNSHIRPQKRSVGDQERWFIQYLYSYCFRKQHLASVRDQTLDVITFQVLLVSKKVTDYQRVDLQTGVESLAVLR